MPVVASVLEFFKFHKMSGAHALLVLVAAYILYAHLVPHRVKRALATAFRMVRNPPAPLQLREPVLRDGYEV